MSKHDQWPVRNARLPSAVIRVRRIKRVAKVVIFALLLLTYALSYTRQPKST